MFANSINRPLRPRPVLLTGLASFLVLGAGATAAQDEIALTFIVRDFEESHADFEEAPSHGFGHYAGSVEHFIGPSGKPVFSGGGYRVEHQARNSSGLPIAPHLANAQFVPGTGESPNQTQVILKDSSGVDAFEITWLNTTFNGDGTSTWRYRVRELETGKDLSHWNLALAEDQQVRPGTTPGYTLGVDGSTGFYGIKWDVDDNFSIGEFVIVLDGHFFGADLSAAVLAKGGNEPDLGSMFAPTDVESDTGFPFNTEDMLISSMLGDDEEVRGPADNGGVNDGTTFYQWYRDTPGVNLSTSITIMLQEQPDGSWLFDSNQDPEYVAIGGFFPIDGDLFGNSGGLPDHNYHFTAEMHATFTYDADADQYFRFTGDDDCWLFIDGKLAIDLGGVSSMQDQYVDVDRFGLTDGETYRMDFFFCERHRADSNLRIETNMTLSNLELPTISASFD